MGQQLLLGERPCAGVNGGKNSQLLLGEPVHVQYRQGAPDGRFHFGGLHRDGQNGVSQAQGTGNVAAVTGDGHIVGVADGAIIKDESLAGIGILAVSHHGGDVVGVVAHRKQELSVHKHGVGLGIGGRESTASFPEVGIELSEELHGRSDNGADLLFIRVTVQRRHCLIAANFIDDIADKGTAGKPRRGFVGKFPGICLAEGEKRLCGSGRVGHNSAVTDQYQLGLGVGSLIAVNVHAKVGGDLGRSGVYIGVEVGKILAEGAKKKPVLFGGGKVLTVDPDQIDTAVGVSGGLITGEFIEDHVDVHSYPLYRDIVGFLAVGDEGVVDPVVHQLVSAPAVESHGGTRCGG